MKAIGALIFLLLSCASGFAGGRGGHVTTWDPNLFGGGWVCFQTQITGCSQGFNATCNGVADDTAAWDSFKTYAAGVNHAKLYIPPGANCSSVGTTNIPAGSNPAHNDGTPLPNVTIWGYGASVASIVLGAQFVPFPDNTHNALLVTANAGDSTITLVTPAQASRFAVGKWILISGISTQTFGYPPNWNVFEYRIVTAINSGVITLSQPLSYSYKSYWPQADVGDASNVNLGGPAMAYVLNDGWNQNLTIYGLRVKQTGTAVFGSVKQAALYDMIFDSVDGLAPSSTQTFSVFYSNIRSPEFDKQVDRATLYQVSGKQFIFQSASTNAVVMSNVTASQGFVGSPNNLTISASTIPTLLMGPTAYGHGTYFNIENSTVNAVVGSNICMNTIANGNAELTFSSGRFTLAKPATVYKGDFYRWAIPESKKYHADSDGTNNAVPPTTFTITDISEDASNYYADTDITGALPNPTCNGHVCRCYTSWQASSVSQKFTGPANLAPFAAP